MRKLSQKMSTKITVEARVNAPIETVWMAWTQPEHIVQWNAASEDWHCPSAVNDLRVGGKFNMRMEAKDQSMAFDFEGTYTGITPQERIAYKLDDDREVVVDFRAEGDSTFISETFDAESVHPAEMQRAGWQSILDNFRRHAEGLASAGAAGR